MNFILLILFIFTIFLVIFLYARVIDEIKNLKGRGLIEEVRKEMESLIVEFNKISNKKIIVTDEKIKELNELIKIADEKIIKLDNLTRNYAEIVKRYEITKKEIQSLESNTLSNKETKTIPNNSTINKQKHLKENQTIKTDVENYFIIDKSDKNYAKDRKNSNLEDLDPGARAELLRELLYKGVEEDELLKMGFSHSEIGIAKIVLSKK